MSETNNVRKTKIFISYSRKDKPFVRKLNGAIDALGIDAWVDWEGIPLSSDWMNEITLSIQASDAFIFVISPDSLRSKVCINELELAISLNKKIIPVLYREPEKRQKLHPKLASTNWVYLRTRKDDFKATLPKLVEAIQTDLIWVQQHTRILQRATEWDHKNRNNSYLLQGSDLEDGERWMTESAVIAERDVIPLQAEYISESRKNAVRHQRNLTIGVGVAMVVSIALGIFALLQWGAAEDNAELARSNMAIAIANEKIAITQQAIAEQNAELALKNANAAKAQRSSAQSGVYRERPGQLDTSTLLALDSWLRLPSSDAENILRNNLTYMPALVKQAQQNGRIWNISSGSDGQSFVTASNDNTACVWSMNGAQKFCVQHNDVVNDAIIVADSKLLITAGADGFVNIWNAEDGTPIQSFDYQSNIWDIAVSPNNKWLAVGRADGAVSLINLLTKRNQLSFDLGNYAIYTLAFSPSSEMLAMGRSDGLVTIWRVMTGISYSGPKHKSEVYALEFSPDNKWLVSVGADSTARVSRADTGATRYILRHNDWVEDVAFGPDGSWFVTVADDNIVRVWDTASGLEKFRMEHSGYILRVEVSPNGQWILTTGFDNTARIWNASSGALTQEISLDAPGTAIAFSPDSSLVIVGDRDGQTSIWDISNLSSRIGYLEFPEIVHKAKFNSTGDWVVFNSDDKNIWRVSADQLTSLRDGTKGEKILTLDNITAQTKVSPNSKWMAITETYGSRAVLFNFETKTRFVLQHKSDISGIGFSADSTRLATTNEGGSSVYIWDVETGNQIKEIPFNETAFTISFNPLDDTLAIGLTDRISIWDTINNREAASLLQIGEIKSLTFSRDGRWLATTSSAGGISIWNMQSGQTEQPAYTFLQDGSITSLDFSPDGKLLASGGSNGYAYLWNLTTGEEQARLPHSDSVSSVSFSPAGNTLLTVSQKTVQVWDITQLEFIDTKDIVELACSRLSKNFSTSEWSFFFYEEEYRILCPNLP